ncbi:MAG: cytochrome c peroxidase [bacterium]
MSLLAATAAAGDTIVMTSLDRELVAALQRAGFTGTIESTLESRLGRPLDNQLADLGRLVFFDSINGLHRDNSCAGCHSPAFGFGDSQSMAIGVDNNGIVGPDRVGPRNQRKAPQVINSAFFPKLMLNGRFVALSGDPFDNSQGFEFPPPEGTTRFPPNDDETPTLLVAQGHIPPTELVEMAGFTGTAGTIGPDFDPFDDGHGQAVPPPDESGFRNEPIRAAVLARFNAAPQYLRRFGRIFNDGRPLPPGAITFSMIGRALAEFENSLTFANAPIDRYARGQRYAMTVPQKRGALLFFGKARCVECHAVAGESNEMFSDFRNHVLGVPQIASTFGVGTGDVMFDGPNRDEDFGREQVSGDAADRYAFRTSPLRNVAVQPAFFHDGAFTTLEDAVRHHLDPVASALAYDPVAAGLDPDLTLRMGPIQPVLERLDPIVAEPTALSDQEFADLVVFVREGLLDPRALPENLCALIPTAVPSGMPIAVFQGCEGHVVSAPDDGPRLDAPLVAIGLRMWPNPAHGPAEVQFDLARGGPVEVHVYDLTGRCVRRLLSGAIEPGRHVVLWDGRNDAGLAVGSGLYFVRLAATEGVAAQRVTLVR